MSSAAEGLAASFLTAPQTADACYLKTQSSGEKVDIKMLTLASTMARQQCHTNTAESIKTAAKSRYLYIGHAGSSFSVMSIETCQTNDVQVVGWLVAVLTEACNGAVNNSRIDLSDCLVVKTIAFKVSWAEAFQEDVSIL